MLSSVILWIGSKRPLSSQHRQKGTYEMITAIYRARQKAMMAVKGFFLLSCAAASLSAFAQVGPEYCGALRSPGQFGPYDYRPDKYVQAGDDQMPHGAKRQLVEGAHFTPRVEALIGGQTGTLPGGDLDYTLRAFPNNHRALVSVMRYAEKMKSQRPPGLHWDVECYFERAIRFQPDDNLARMIYAKFLTKNNRKPEAIRQLNAVVKSAGDNAFTYHNAGLLYFDLQEYQEALTQEHKAIEFGLVRPELRAKLEALGKWQDAIDTGAAASAPEASAASGASIKP